MERAWLPRSCAFGKHQDNSAIRGRTVCEQNDTGADSIEHVAVAISAGMQFFEGFL